MSEGEAKSGVALAESPGPLKPDQNFFDQEPFKGVLEHSAAKSGLPIEKLRRTIAACRVKLREIAETPEDKERILREIVYGTDEKASYLSSIGSLGQTPPQVFETALREVLEQLDPLVFEYIDDKFDNGIYSLKGDIMVTIKSDPKDFFPPSYSRWIEVREKLKKKEKNQVLLGIEDAFNPITPARTHARASSNKKVRHVA